MTESTPTQTHESFTRHAEVKAGSNRAFGLVMAAFFAIIGLFPLLRHREARWWSVWVSSAFLVFALVAPSALGPLNLVWTKIGIVLNSIISPVVMGVLFFLVFAPMGALMRLLGKDPLGLRFDSTRESYWLRKNPPGPPPDGMPRQF